MTTDRLATLSFVSLIATIVATSAHHIFRLGLEVAVPAAAVLAGAVMFFVMWRRNGARGWFLAYATLAALVVAWFGVLDGFLDHVLKAAGTENVTFLPGSEAEVVATVFNLWSQEATTAFYEGTGVLTAVFAAVALGSTVLLSLRLFRPPLRA